MKAQKIFLGFRHYQSRGEEKDFHPRLVTYLRVIQDSRSETGEKALSHSHQPFSLSGSYNYDSQIFKWLPLCLNFGQLKVPRVIYKISLPFDFVYIILIFSVQENF